ncbi:aldehyde dehydrogenase family protein [Nocardiopsis oceani]
MTKAASGKTFEVTSPIDEASIATVPDAGADEVAAAVTAAEQAFKLWRRTPAKERATAVRAMADVVDQHAEELAVLDVVDCGAPITQMRADLARSSEALRYFAGLALEAKGETVPASGENLHFTLLEPFGVVARIIPFNHPAMFAITKIAAPVVAGNCVVLKPPEAAPLSALRMGELFSELLPPGVLSVVVGDGPEVPRTLVRHPSVHRIGFIGSEPTGRAIQRDAAETGVKSVTLELGGKNAFIACPDIDIDAASSAAIRGMNFGWAGQSCGSTSRLLVHESIADELVQAVVDKLDATPMTSPLNDGATLGPMSSMAQYEKTLGYIDLAVTEGATVLAGGGPPEGFEKGYFVRPTVLGDVQPEHRIANEEVFGPVLSVLTWREEGEVIALANGVEYGLTASVWTNDLARAQRIVRELDVGYVWVNGATQHFPGMPFGGVKASGIGREECLDELLSYTRTKAVNVIQSY